MDKRGEPDITRRENPSTIATPIPMGFGLKQDVRKALPKKRYVRKKIKRRRVKLRYR